MSLIATGSQKVGGSNPPSSTIRGRNRGLLASLLCSLSTRFLITIANSRLSYNTPRLSWVGLYFLAQVPDINAHKNGV